MRIEMTLLVGLALLAGPSLPAAPQNPLSGRDQARQILATAGVTGGLVGHLGCGDGALTAALHASDSFLVHGLDADAKKIKAARQRIQALGLSGQVSAEPWTDDSLPFIDNLVNLIVVSGDWPVSSNELLRVLAPNGVALFLNSQFSIRNSQLKKPWPGGLDEWTHWLHDAGNNAVAHDTQVGSPRRMQWVVDPLWSRGHEVISSVGALVTARGRLFCVLDEGQTSIYSLPSRWSLMARDAFNGVLLWKRPLPDWSAPVVLGGFNVGFQPRRLVTDGESVYFPSGREAVLSALDAATGQNVKTLPEARGTSDILCADGLLVVFCAPETTVGKTRKKSASGSGVLIAARCDTLKVLWKAPVQDVVEETLALSSGRLFFKRSGAVVALDAKSGAELWTAAAQEPAAGKGGKGADKALVVSGGGVFQLSGSTLTAFSVEQGKILWQQKASGSHGELLVANGRLWLVQDSQVAGYDPVSGASQTTIDVSSIFSDGHHPRCYPAKATDRFVITANRGAEFVSLTSPDHTQNDWLRGNCGEGVVPANGLLYVGPVQCFCYPGAMLTGFKALAPGPVALPSVPATDASRLERGPAFSANRQSPIAIRNSEDWPTYRHDAERFGSTMASVPAAVAPLWKVALGGRVTPAVIADGLVLVAATDAHTIHALSASDGKTLWTYTAAGRIDSPPTISEGLVLFGCADGRAYCLRASDGALGWRFQAAPSAQRFVACGQLESPWRVHGSILLKKGVAYLTAGRASYLDGGIWLFGLDPKTGRVLHEAHLDTWARTRDDAKNKPFLPAYHMEAARSDILVSEGDFIYLGQYKFDLALARQTVPYVMPGPDARTVAMDLSQQPFVSEDVAATEEFETRQRQWMDKTHPKLVEEFQQAHGGYSLGDRTIGRHVFSTAGFLDDSWFNRTYWMYSATWPGFYIAHRAAKTGQLLVVGPDHTYAVEAYTSRNLQSPLFEPGGKGYLLFADRNDNEPVLADRTRGTTKGWGFTRKEPPAWFQWVPVRIRGLALAGPHLFVSGPPDVAPADDPLAAFEGRQGGLLWTFSAADGKKLAELKLDSPPVFDGLVAAGGRLFLSTTDGQMICLAGKP